MLTPRGPGRTWPSYLGLLEGGELARRARRATEMLRSCRLCPRVCGVDRLGGELGQCRTAEHARVSSAQLHFGEEAPLVGRGGSGTIFFTHCNLSCIYCQNHDISHGGIGRVVSHDELAAVMLRLQDAGAMNINVVSPSHVVPQVLNVLALAASRGLRLPLVYNTGGYDAQTTLRLLDGVVDIYMPDTKYADPEVGVRASGVNHYPLVNRQNLREMHRQVGDLVLDDRGVARRGLLVRHLVLPADLAGTRSVLRFVADEISRDTYVNVMAQYRPSFRASRMPELDRPLRGSEHRNAVAFARQVGLHRLDT